MTLKRLIALLAVSALAIIYFVPSGVVAQKVDYKVDKALCAKMIAAGEEYYIRGKYLDAKNFFRKAVQADPGSMKAWRYYDQAVIFALAEKVEKKNDLLVPDISIRSEASALPSGAPSPDVQRITPQPSAGQKDAGGAIFEEEGC